MDSSPPPYTRPSPAARPKLVSRLALPPPSPQPSTAIYPDHDLFQPESQLVPFNLDAAAASPALSKKAEAAAMDSPSSPRLHLSPAAAGSPSPVSLRELLLMSPRRKSRVARPLAVVAANAAFDEQHAGDAGTPRKKGKTGRSAASVTGVVGCAGSPRNVRRARRRLEKEIIVKEEKGDLAGPAAPEEDIGRTRKRKQCKSKPTSVQGKPSSTPLIDPSVPSPGAEATHENDGGSLDSLYEQVSELVMWKNTAKSTLWFGVGSMFFSSSYFSDGISFSIVSAVCQLGLLILGFTYLRNSIPQREQIRRQGNFQMTEEDIFRAAQLILPFLNAVLAKTQEIFSGDPLRTLKIAPILLLGAKYGHLMTLWRLFAAGFFISFTVPKLYSCYSQQIQNKVNNAINWVRETWRACPRKKLIAAATVALSWNLFSVKARLFAAFISIVLLRYRNEHVTEEKGQQQVEVMEE